MCGGEDVVHLAGIDHQLMRGIYLLKACTTSPWLLWLCVFFCFFCTVAWLFCHSIIVLAETHKMIHNVQAYVPPTLFLSNQLKIGAKHADKSNYFSNSQA